MSRGGQGEEEEGAARLEEVEWPGGGGINTFHSPTSLTQVRNQHLSQGGVELLAHPTHGKPLFADIFLNHTWEGLAEF